MVEQADPAQFRTLLPLLHRHASEATSLLMEKFRDSRLPRWQNSHSTQSSPPRDLRQAVESAQGWIDSEFALCQTLPLEEVHELVHSLSRYNYRLIRLRPFATHKGLQVAAVWLRDQQEWDWGVGLTRVQLEARLAEEQRFVPQDVAGYLLPANEDSAGEEEPRFSVVWAEPRFEGERRRAYFGLPTKQSDVLQDKYTNLGYRELSRHLYTDRSGEYLQHSMIWGLDAANIAGSIYDVKTENTIQVFHSAFEAAVDLCVVPVEDPAAKPSTEEFGCGRP